MVGYEVIKVNEVGGAKIPTVIFPTQNQFSVEPFVTKLDKDSIRIEFE